MRILLARYIPCLALAAAVYAQQSAPTVPRQVSAPVPVPALPAPGAFSGSVRGGEPTPGTLALTIEDAIARGLKYNLGAVESGLDIEDRRAERLRTLSELLPTVSIRPSVTEEQINLASFGFSFPGVPRVVGPFTVYDLRGYVSQSVLNFPALRGYRAGAETVKASQWSFRDAREQVVVTVVTLYLTAIAGAARIEAAQAQVTTADALFRQASDRKNAGTAPAIDVLRAQVELQAQQQRLIFYEGEFDKQKINLGRAIGLAGSQSFNLADPAPYSALAADVDIPKTLDQAYSQRADYQAAQSLVHAAELQKAAARGERLPSAGFTADYGANGPKPNETNGSFTIAASVNIPVFTGRRVEADVLQADTLLRQRQAQLDDLRGKIESDVRTSVVDLRSAARQLEVARSNTELARQELTQSKDRFAAGVTNNVEVVQAQEAVATADENYISSLNVFNTAKAQLARARGDGERGVVQFLKGK